MKRYELLNQTINDHGYCPVDKANMDIIEAEIRNDAKKECGEALLKIINEKPYGTEKHNLWLISQIRHFCFGVPRICDEIVETKEVD